MTIHTIGDSHARFGWTNIINHNCWSMLCYNFGREKLNRVNISNFDIKDGDTVVFCFCEIDCRCHIHKNINDDISYQSIIDDIVSNYFEAIQINITVSGLNFKKICVYNVVPPIEKYNTEENPSYPYLGTDEERKDYVLYFNKKLKEYCIKYSYTFFDIYDKYIDNNGYLRKDLSDNIVHINNGIYINDFIVENDI